MASCTTYLAALDVSAAILEFAFEQEYNFRGGKVVVKLSGYFGKPIVNTFASVRGRVR